MIKWSDDVKKLLISTHVFAKSSGLSCMSKELLLSVAIELFPEHVRDIGVNNMGTLQIELLRTALKNKQQYDEYVDDEIIVSIHKALVGDQLELKPLVSALFGVGKL